MEIKRFYDEGLSHASYAVCNNKEMALIDPARDPKPYYDFAKKKAAKIVGVIETHPHADFVSGHLEIHKATGATIYVSKLVKAAYPHKTFDDGDAIHAGKILLKAHNTPGHSPDSICILAEDENGKNHAVFTGDTLFIGDVGRPDLRENSGNVSAKREELARQMYQTTRGFIMKLEKDVIVYPAHGAGSLCGKNLSSALSSTIGKELEENDALRDMPEDEFVKILLEDLPFVPKYFGYNVHLNKEGAGNFEENVKAIPRFTNAPDLEEGILLIDSRPQSTFQQGHMRNAINLMDGLKFETWLGSILAPDEPFYLLAENKEILDILIRKAAKIGYEKNIRAAFTSFDDRQKKVSLTLDLGAFKADTNAFTIVDIRNASELTEKEFFKNAMSIPLPELRERAGEVPIDKPVVVHCAGGYRSAAGASILEKELPNAKVYDLGEAIANF